MVTTLMASPMAQGLFHKAIAASGSALNTWGITNDPVKVALNISTRLGCYDGSSPPNLNEIGECMQLVSNAIPVRYCSCGVSGEYQQYNLTKGH